MTAWSVATSQWKWAGEKTANVVALLPLHTRVNCSLCVFEWRLSVLQLRRWRSASQRFQSRHPATHVRRPRPTAISARTNQLLPGEHGVSVAARLQHNDEPTKSPVHFDTNDSWLKTELNLHFSSLSLFQGSPLNCEWKAYNVSTNPELLFSRHAPCRGTVAHKIMQKYGFKEGQGLGKHEQGLSTALSVEKTSKRGGKIIIGDAAEKRECRRVPLSSARSSTEPLLPVQWLHSTCVGVLPKRVCVRACVLSSFTSCLFSFSWVRVMSSRLQPRLCWHTRQLRRLASQLIFSPHQCLLTHSLIILFYITYFYFF